MQRVIEGLVESGYRENVKIMVGGGPITHNFAIQIGADAYSDNAIEAVSVAKRLCGLA
jgi:predicted cobalamin binding protein